MLLEETQLKAEAPAAEVSTLPFTTLPQLLLHSARIFGRRNALSFPRKSGWLSFSYAELLERVSYLALGLHDLGIRKGESVGLIAPSSPLWIMVDLAIQIAGGVTVPIFKRISVESFTHEVQDSGMRYLFVGNPEEMPMAFEHAGPGVTTISFWYSGTHPLFDQILERGAALQAREPELFERLCRAVRPSELATIIYTSGSTGLPKGVELVQSNLVSQVLAAAEVFPSDPDKDVCLSVLPPEHIFERMVLYFYLSRGLPVYFVDHPKKVAEFMRSVRPTILTVVPRILDKVADRLQKSAGSMRGLKGALARAALARAAKRPVDTPPKPIDRLYDRLVYGRMREALGGRLRYAISGSARLDPQVGRLLLNVGIPVYEGYGLTESSPVIAANREGARRLGTVGRPFPGVEVRIAADGEILARGPNVMRGYHNHPEATAAVLASDGWLRTGDLGSLDEEGYLTISGRKKELFKKSTGEYVPPGPVEKALGEIPFVDTPVIVADNRVYVVALLFPDPEKLQEVKKQAGLENMPDQEFLHSEYLRDRTQAQIEAINAHLHHCERVERFTIMDHPAEIEGGELTPTLKPRRYLIEQKYREVIEEMYRSLGGWK
jgi:long-chain acyl-CoA synthetase